MPVIPSAGKEDQWIETERGIGALHYILFQRSVALFTILLLAISVTSLAINLSQEDEGKIFLHRTASSNLPKGDPKFWFHVVSTSLIPWVAFLLLQRLRRSVGKLKPGACQFGKTLMLQPLKMKKKSYDPTLQPISSTAPLSRSTMATTLRW